MKPKYIAGIVIALLLVFLFAGGCSSYNGMVDADQSVQKQWGQVENQYQRRYDLIPNLVSTVQGYAKHESNTLETVTNARAGLSEAYNEAREAAVPGQAPADMAAFQRKQAALDSALGIYVNAVHEAYPDLKASENFLNLQAQLEGTENRIATERMRYNEAVETYNRRVLRFPGRLFAGLFGFDSKQMFAADAQAQQAPRVQF